MLRTVGILGQVHVQLRAELQPHAASDFQSLSPRRPRVGAARDSGSPPMWAPNLLAARPTGKPGAETNDGTSADVPKFIHTFPRFNVFNRHQQASATIAWIKCKYKNILYISGQRGIHIQGISRSARPHYPKQDASLT